MGNITSKSDGQQLSLPQVTKLKTRSSAMAEIARDADDVDFSVDDVYSALTLPFNFFQCTPLPNRRC